MLFFFRCCLERMKEREVFRWLKQYFVVLSNVYFLLFFLGYFVFLLLTMIVIIIIFFQITLTCLFVFCHFTYFFAFFT